MKIEMEIYSAEEFAAFAQFSASMAGVMELRRRPDRVIGGAGQGSALIPADGDPAKIAEAVKAAAELKTSVEAEVKPKATRTPRKPSETAPATDTTKADDKPADPPAITFDEVKKLILDHLNDWTAAAPSDKDIRMTVLKPLLKALDAQKIKEIDPARFKEVAGVIDESAAKLAEFIAQRAPTEEE